MLGDMIGAAGIDWQEIVFLGKAKTAAHGCGRRSVIG
jgi:hypothetical protein